MHKRPKEEEEEEEKLNPQFELGYTLLKLIKLEMS